MAILNNPICPETLCFLGFSATFLVFGGYDIVNLHTFFTLLTTVMKRIVTVFLVVLFSFIGIKVDAQVNAIAIRPGSEKPIIINAPFVSPKQYAPIGNPASPQEAPEVLRYYSPDMIDGDGMLVEGQYTFFNIPDTTERADGTEADGMYWGNQLMTRFVSNLSPIYLDSVQFIVAARNVPNRFMVLIYQDSAVESGFPSPNLGRAQVGQPFYITKDSLSEDPELLSIVTLNTKHRKLALSPSYSNSFFIALNALSTPGSNAFFGKPNDNDFGVLCDRVIDERELDPELDHMWQSRTRFDGTYTSWNPVAGRFGFDNDQDGQLDETLYPNMYMIAFLSDGTTGVDDIKLEGNGLAQNYPNPFNPSTVIKYSVENAGNATLKVYNALGSEVASLVDGFVGQGEHSVTFDASGLPTGTYYYTFKSGDFTKTKHMVLSK